MARSLWCFPLLLCVTAGVRADDWPQWLGPRRDGVWREKGLLETFPRDGLKPLWTAPLGAGYSGPAVADGRVYVMDRQRAKDADGKPKPPARTGIPGTERVVCLDAKSGKQIWVHEYDCPYKVSYPSGPRVTPLVRDGKVWTVGAMGDHYCLDAAKGTVVWSKNLVKEYKAEVPVWGFAAHPLLDGDRLICTVGGKGSAVVAFDKDTGKELWKGLDTEEIGYSPPVIVEAGGKRQLLVWLSESLFSLDPATGKQFWKEDYPGGDGPQRPSVNIAMPRVHGDQLFLTSFYHGPIMFQLGAKEPTAKVLWRGKSDDAEKPDGMHTTMTTPFIKDGHVYGVGAMGELICQTADTGKTLWTSLEAVGKKAECATVFLIPQGDRFVLFTDLGDLILADLTPKGYKELARTKIIKPDHGARGRTVVWCHPAFADRCVFVRNDHEMVCVSLAAEK